MKKDDHKIDLEDRIKNWLMEEGYPLELNVAKIFQDAGLNVIQSEVYIDPEKKYFTRN